MPATTTSTLDDKILSYNVDPVTLLEHRGSALHRYLAWIRDASGDRSGVHKFPRYAKSDVPAGTKTEGDAFATVAASTDGVDATAGVVGIGRELTDEASQDAGTQITELIQMSERGISERITSDLLSIHTSSTNQTDESGNALDLTIWGAAKTAFMSQNPNGMPQQLAFVAHTETIGQLEAAMRTTSAGYASREDTGSAMFNSLRGFKGLFEGIAVFETTLVPEEDATNWSGAFSVIGPMGVYGLAVWWDVRHRMQPAANKATQEVYSSTRYGYALTDPAQIHELITVKAA